MSNTGKINLKSECSEKDIQILKVNIYYHFILNFILIVFNNREPINWMVEQTA